MTVLLTIFVQIFLDSDSDSDRDLFNKSIAYTILHQYQYFIYVLKEKQYRCKLHKNARWETSTKVTADRLRRGRPGGGTYFAT